MKPRAANTAATRSVAAGRGGAFKRAKRAPDQAPKAKAKAKQNAGSAQALGFAIAWLGLRRGVAHAPPRRCPGHKTATADHNEHNAAASRPRSDDLTSTEPAPYLWATKSRNHALFSAFLRAGAFPVCVFFLLTYSLVSCTIEWRMGRTINQEDQRMNPALSEEEARAVAGACDTFRDRAMLMLALTGGLNCAQIANLRVHHVLDARSQAMEWIGIPRSADPNCDFKRWQRIPLATRQALLQFLFTEGLAWCRRPVFLSPKFRGQPISHRHVARLLMACFARGGVMRPRPVDALRFTFWLHFDKSLKCVPEDWAAKFIEKPIAPGHRVHDPEEDPRQLQIPK